MFIFEIKKYLKLGFLYDKKLSYFMLYNAFKIVILPKIDIKIDYEANLNGQSWLKIFNDFKINTYFN